MSQMYNYMMVGELYMFQYLLGYILMLNKLVSTG